MHGQANLLPENLTSMGRQASSILSATAVFSALPASEHQLAPESAHLDEPRGAGQPPENTHPRSGWSAIRGTTDANHLAPEMSHLSISSPDPDATASAIHGSKRPRQGPVKPHLKQKPGHKAAKIAV